MNMKKGRQTGIVHCEYADGQVGRNLGKCTSRCTDIQVYRNKLMVLPEKQEDRNKVKTCAGHTSEGAYSEGKFDRNTAEHTCRSIGGQEYDECTQKKLVDRKTVKGYRSCGGQEFMAVNFAIRRKGRQENQ